MKDDVTILGVGAAEDRTLWEAAVSGLGQCHGGGFLLLLGMRLSLLHSGNLFLVGKLRTDPATQGRRFRFPPFSILL